MTDEPPSLKPVSDTIESAIASADASPANVVPLDTTKRKTRRRRATDEDTTREPRDGGYDVDRMNQTFAMLLMGSKAAIFMSQPSAKLDERMRFLTPEAFGSWLANTRTELPGPDGKIRSVTYAQRFITDPRRRSFKGLEFFPNPDGAEPTPEYLNLWTGFEFKPKPKPDGYSVFADHLLTNVCEGNERLFQYLFAWFAQMFQRPRERPGVAIVLRGKRGTGKSSVGETFGRLIFQHYYQVDSPTYITGRFNFHLGRCLLLEADEATWAGDKAAEGRLKGLITAPFQMIEPKNIDAARLANHVRLLMTTNENWAIPAGPDERRFFVLDVSDRCAQNHDYFAEMKAQLEDGGYEALLHDLLTFDLTTVNLFEAPKTAALLYQKNRSTDPIASWWKDRLWAGTTLRSADSWDQVVRCTVLFDDYIAAAERVGVGRKAQETIFGIELKSLVPGLSKCRPTIGATRAWHYKIPPLRDCRDAWDEFIQQPEDWPPEEENGGDSLGEREAAADF